MGGGVPTCPHPRLAPILGTDKWPKMSVAWMGAGRGWGLRGGTYQQSSSYPPFATSRTGALAQIFLGIFFFKKKFWSLQLAFIYSQNLSYNSISPIFCSPPFFVPNICETKKGFSGEEMLPIFQTFFWGSISGTTFEIFLEKEGACSQFLFKNFGLIRPHV